jgi:hypothetical protein
VSSLSPTDLQRLIDQLLLAREHLLRRPVQHILTSIDRVVARFLDPSAHERQKLEAQLPLETGLSPEMIRHTLPIIFREYRANRLQSLLQHELGSPAVLDNFVAGQSGYSRVISPQLITQVLAGNLPGAGLDGVIFALVVKSATLVKTPSSTSSLPLHFARALAQVDPELAACLAVVRWASGQTALEEKAFARADVVIASGSDKTLAAIRPYVRGQFIGYGHKVSFSVIAREALTGSTEVARQTAYDIVLFDQQGCLSPQLVYVEEGGMVSPKGFAKLLAQAFAQWEKNLPRGNIPQEASIAIRRVRDEAEWQALAGKDVALYASSPGTEWTVIYETDPTFAASPLYRTVYVKPLTTFTQLFDLLDQWRPYLEAVGVAADPDRLRAFAELLGRAGASRICPIGTMQTPPLSWRHGGRPRIADLVRWVGVEM